jgi:hypothetical protein
VVTLLANDLFDRRVAVSLLQVALSRVDAVQQRVGVGFVAVINLSGQDHFGFQVDGVFLLVRQVSVQYSATARGLFPPSSVGGHWLLLHDTSVRVAGTLPVLNGRLLAFAFSIELPQVVVVVDLDAVGIGQTQDVRFPVLAGVHSHDPARPV